ncbi:hypothetical protein ABEB36_006550 [Hypothenemus hampei]|uniref:Uncharacterized protein n=1 Tax=Hypothenemus hampei TaxID=57062 RepID=A0ABD1EQW2_HYPHA
MAEHDASRFRTKDVVFPDGFASENVSAERLIKQLLIHDISKQPTFRELLQFKYLLHLVSGWSQRKFKPAFS